MGSGKGIALPQQSQFGVGKLPCNHNSRTAVNKLFVGDNSAPPDLKRQRAGPLLGSYKCIYMYDYYFTFDFTTQHALCSLLLHK